MAVYLIWWTSLMFLLKDCVPQGDSRPMYQISCFFLSVGVSWVLTSRLLPLVSCCRYCRPKPSGGPLARPSTPSTASTPCSSAETRTLPRSSRSVPLTAPLLFFSEHNKYSKQTRIVLCVCGALCHKRHLDPHVERVEWSLIKPIEVCVELFVIESLQFLRRLWNVLWPVNVLVFT